MGILDAPMGALADNLIGQFGRSATLRRPGAGGEFDTKTLAIAGAGASTDTTVPLVFVEFEQSSIPRTVIQAGDRVALVPRLSVGVEPVPDEDELIEGGRTWKIVGVKGISSGESEAAYELHLRR